MIKVEVGQIFEYMNYRRDGTAQYWRIVSVDNEYTCRIIPLFTSDHDTYDHYKIEFLSDVSIWNLYKSPNVIYDELEKILNA